MQGCILAVRTLVKPFLRTLYLYLNTVIVYSKYIVLVVYSQDRKTEGKFGVFTFYRRRLPMIAKLRRDTKLTKAKKKTPHT